MNAARQNVKRLEADHDSEVARFRHDISDLQSALDAQKEAVSRANQTISNLEAALVTAREDSEGLQARKPPVFIGAAALIGYSTVCPGRSEGCGH